MFLSRVEIVDYKQSNMDGWMDPMLGVPCQVSTMPPTLLQPVTVTKHCDAPSPSTRSLFLVHLTDSGWMDAVTYSLPWRYHTPARTSKQMNSELVRSLRSFEPSQINALFLEDIHENAISCMERNGFKVANCNILVDCMKESLSEEQLSSKLQFIHVLGIRKMKI
jgi:hypothetical protein